MTIRKGNCFFLALALALAPAAAIAGPSADVPEPSIMPLMLISLAAMLAVKYGVKKKNK